jgi:hypothetical protein
MEFFNRLSSPNPLKLTVFLKLGTSGINISSSSSSSIFLKLLLVNYSPLLVYGVEESFEAVLVI